MIRNGPQSRTTPPHRGRRTATLALAAWAAGAATLAAQATAPRPQEPAPPLPYRVEEVTYENPAAGIRLAGTLTLPPGGGPFPAVILISGSGPQNRDSDVFGHRTFLVLADHLTRSGIAVLRSDDRGVGASGGSFEEATTADFASDAAAALAYLRSRGEVRRDGVGVIGLSEGGLVAPLLAAEHPEDVAFVVLMAAPGVPGEKILYDQSALIARAMGAPDAQIAYNRALQEEVFTVVRDAEDPEARARGIEEVLRTQLAAVPPEERAARGLTPEAEDEWVRAQLRQMASPWFRYFLLHDPAPVLARVRAPVLALAGDLDLQVPPQENLDAIRSALAAGGNGDVTVVRFPGVNHLFQRARLGVPAEYPQIQETLSPEVMARVSEWIREKTAAR